MGHPTYPWYQVVQDDSLEQGDILLDCPIFQAPVDLNVDDLDRDAPESTVFDWFRYDVMVMSQTCDLVKGREKVDEVLLCPLYEQSDFPDGEELSKPKGWENARKGRFPAYHVVNACSLGGHEFASRVVGFRSVFSLPTRFVRSLAGRRGERVRLLPPYREHLSQSFARYFMRVGLPVDIPPFK